VLGIALGRNVAHMIASTASSRADHVLGIALGRNVAHMIDASGQRNVSFASNH
jgi:DNA-binding transcriptional regulator LsrR (DeoR family)